MRWRTFASSCTLAAILGCSSTAEFPGLAGSVSSTPTPSGSPTATLPPLPSPVSTTIAALTVINECWPVVSVDAGDPPSVLLKEPVTATPGMELLLWQTVSSGSDAGIYELVQVYESLLETPGTRLILVDAPTLFRTSYQSAGGSVAQACPIPRFQDVSVQAGGTLRAVAWGNERGGLVALRALGNVQIDTGGSVDAAGLGFPGGSEHVSATCTASVATADTADPDAAGAKGSGNAPVAAAYGRGNSGNGGGGGNSCRSGGGGGGNGGAGGRGGFQNEAFPNASTTWGLPGVSFPFTTDDRLTLGGGGGAGHRAVGTCPNNPLCARGGTGGGLVLLLGAGTLTGTGLVTADGTNGRAGSGTTDFVGVGAGGGGAGGSIHVELVHGAFGGTISAIGGNGGNTAAEGVSACGGSACNNGPGGGGGGGRIHVPDAALRSAAAGANGTVGDPHGAEPGVEGILE